MGRGERDKVDTSLIVTKPRVPRPTARARGLDYGEGLSTPNVPEKAKDAKIAAAESASNTSSEKKQLTINTLFLKDASKPEGEACNPDGTLKDADKIEWLNSPSDLAPAPFENHKIQNEDDETDNERVTKRRRLCKRSDGAHSSDNTSDAENSTKGTARPRPSSMTVDAGATEGETVEEGFDEAEGGYIETESEDEDPDATRRYWEVKRKNEGVRRPKKKSRNTQDLRLCFVKDVRMIKNKEVAGEYCKLCLEKGAKKADAFFTGNGSSHRTHISRFHYRRYLEICEDKGVEPKAHAPEEFQKKNKGQKSMDGFVVAVKKPTPIPPVTKAGLKEYLLEYIVDGDLSFRSVERPSFLRLIRYLCPKLNTSDIPKRTCMGDAVMEKVAKLDEIDLDLVNSIDSLVSIVYDGWSSKRRRSFASYSIQYIYSPPEDPYHWSLRSHLLGFHQTVGRHTGIMVGKDIIGVIQKFGLKDKFGWLVGDNVPVNDVAVRHVCKTLDPWAERLDAKEVRGRCIEHSIHLMACHFVTALNVPGIGRTKAKVHASSLAPAAQQELNEFEESFDVDISMEVEPSPDDAEAMHAAFDVTFDAGDVVGKLMAFIAQLRVCSDDVHKYLLQIATSLGCPAWEIKLWVRTRWGSLSDCFRTVLGIQKGIDRFCRLADDEDELPPLANGKKWANYLLSGPEWDIIRLAHDCLDILKTAHGELSAENAPTCFKVFPLVEMLQSKWDDLLEDERYEPVHEALTAGLKNMAKWYRKADDTSIYFISHVLDPTWKLSYVQAAWHTEFVEDNMDRLRDIYLKYHAKYHAASGNRPQIVATRNPTNTLCRQNSSTEQWMAQIVKKAKPTTLNRDIQVAEPLSELNRFFESDTLSRTECPDIIAWYGLKSTEKEFPVIRLMARDYMAIPASSCLAERSFSMSARTDDVRRRQMKSEKFGALQRLRAAYRDGRLDAVKESWMEIDPSFDIDIM